MTVRDFIRRSLVRIGVLADNETANATMLADGISTLNEMFDTWSSEGILIHTTTREEFALTAGEASRTMGPTGNFITTRPTQIEKVGVKSNGQEIPVAILTVSEWAEIRDKTLTSDIPSKIYFEGTFPNETLNLWPVPSLANNLVIYSLKPFSTYTAASEISFPPGYQEAIKYNLDLRMFSEYGKPATQETFDQAAKTLANIKRKNTKPGFLTSDLAGNAHDPDILIGS